MTKRLFYAIFVLLSSALLAVYPASYQRYSSGVTLKNALDFYLMGIDLMTGIAPPFLAGEKITSPFRRLIVSAISAGLILFLGCWPTVTTFGDFVVTFVTVAVLPALAAVTVMCAFAAFCRIGEAYELAPKS